MADTEVLGKEAATAHDSTLHVQLYYIAHCAIILYCTWCNIIFVQLYCTCTICVEVYLKIRAGDSPPLRTRVPSLYDIK